MFNQFLSQLGELKDKPIQLKQLKKLLKVEEKTFPKNIHLHYVEFQKHIQTKWQRKDKMVFLWTVLKYLQHHQRDDLKLDDNDWENISNILQVPKKILNTKWISMLKTNLKLQPFSEAEDSLLLKVMTQEFTSWTDVAIEFNKQTNTMRHAKQVRERWNNYLDPQLNKNQWNEQEQIQLLKFVQQYGKKWSLIAKQIQGRTENQVKNAYNSLINHYKRLHVAFKYKNQQSTLESDQQIVNNLLLKLDPPLQQVNSVTQFIQSPIQQQILLQALFNERLKSLAYLAQFTMFPLGQNM